MRYKKLNIAALFDHGYDHDYDHDYLCYIRV